MRSRLSFLPLYLPLVLCLSQLTGAAALANEHFPKPAALESDVNFWLRVYTEIDTNRGFIHDAHTVAIVYETLQLTGRRRADDISINAVKARYATILEHLASTRSGLSEEQQRVLALWGSDVSNARLRKAAGNLRFQRGQADRFREGLARSGEWRDHIASVLDERDLPRELAALPHVESSFNPDAYSSAGAAGIWQFTRSTGRRYMHIDYVLDERMDPLTATAAATQLLQHNYQLTGTWPLALTAYNHGTSGVRRAMKQLGTTDIASIVRQYKGRSFGFASRNFYVSFLAALEISDNPERYFAPYNSAQPVQYRQFTLPDYLPADSLVQAFNIDVALLRRHNRALLDPVWSGKKRIPRGYTLRIPRARTPAVSDQALAAIPADQWFTEQTPDLFHKVSPGDTVSEIAARYGHSIRDVAAMNGLNKRYRIRVGQVLRLPLEGTVAIAEVDPSAPTRVQLASVGDVPRESPVTATDNGAAESPKLAAGTELMVDPGNYSVATDASIEVQAAETLGHYAEWLDLRASHLRQINGMRYGRPVVIGHRLKLDFSRVSQADFERRRLAYQYDLQRDYFMTWQIRATRRHVIAPGESLWALTRQQFKVPMWLLRQYNPDLDPDKLRPGTVIVIPELVEA